MVVLGCVQTLRLMKDSFTSKSRCWAGRCPWQYLVTLSSLKRANSHSIHTAAFSQVTSKQAFVVRHLNAEQCQLSERTPGCSLGLCLHSCCSWGKKGELGMRRGQVLSWLIGWSQKQWGFQFFSTLFSFGKFRVFNFLIFSNLPPWACVKLSVLALFSLFLLFI